MRKTVMFEKAHQAQMCYENLMQQTGIYPKVKVIFHVNTKQKKQFEAAAFSHNPFLGTYKLQLFSKRKKALKRLFASEKVLQTGPLAAVLALDAALAQEIGDLRNGSVAVDPIICDVGLAGLQAIRPYMTSYEGKLAFAKARHRSALQSEHALNGASYKYKTGDDRYFSVHVYSLVQKWRMLELLNLQKDPQKLTLSSLRRDKKQIRKAIAGWTAPELEEASFENGLCSCMVRSRNEWENSEVGKAVGAMPMYRLRKAGAAPIRRFGNADMKKGPLSGIKVLDLTHMIAGPACTRLLAEQGADVLMVRRGKFAEQEQSMAELDGWAGKSSIQLDFNDSFQLNRTRQLVKEADIIISSYQDGALDRFGLGEEDIHQLNPHAIYGSVICFSDSVWKQRPGYSSCAEDMTGLSCRNGKADKPFGLNGSPLDYISGMILFGGILKALKMQMTEGGAYSVTVSLTRCAMWLHECTDLWETSSEDADRDRNYNSEIQTDLNIPDWRRIFHRVPWTSVGKVYFLSAAVWSRNQSYYYRNMRFLDGCDGFPEK